MNPPRIVRLEDVPPTPWKNGGGRTRELLAWPPGEWSFRVSVAEIESDGPFSSFPGITRWFTVVKGEGVVLRFGSEEHRLDRKSDPLRFDGARSPGCRLIDGPTLDLNLMLRGGRGTMVAAHPDEPWAEDFEHRGLFARAPGRWVPARGEPVALPAGSLLWQFEATPDEWRFEPDSADPHSVAGWWLGCTLEKTRVSS